MLFTFGYKSLGTVDGVSSFPKFQRLMYPKSSNPTVSIRVVFVDGELDFDGCYITTAHILGFVLQNMAIWVVFVDVGLDFDECYITTALVKPIDE